MGKFRTIYENLVDLAAAISASSEETDLPATNVAHPFRTYKWRATGDSNETITIDLGSEYSVLAVALIGHNFSSGAAIKYQSSNDSDFDPLIADEALTWRNGIIFKFLTSNSARYHRVNIQDASNPDGYVELGRLFLGDYFEPVKNFHMRFSDGGDDLSTVSPSEGGQIFGDEKSERRKLGLNWTAPVSMNNDDKQDFQAFVQSVKTTRPFVLFLDHELLPAEVYYGRLVNRPTFQNQNNLSWWETTIEFEEAL